VEMEDLAHRTYFLQPASELTEVFPSIPPEGISVTFDRKRALSREDMSFLSWDHPMTTRAIDMVLSSGTGSASFGLLRGANNPGVLMEFIFVLETKSDQTIYVDRFLPNTPIRVVVDYTGKEQTEAYSVELLNKNLIPGSIEPLLDNDTLVETILPNMIAAAKKIAEKRSKIEIDKGLQHMNLTLNHEIERLKMLQRKNRNIRAEEIQIALSEQLTLASLIENARLRMDAIQLILKS
jgi:ATP-dependent helicase HepA